MSPLAHDEIEELLGAYALDAVDPDEAERRSRRHLADVPALPRRGRRPPRGRRASSATPAAPPPTGCGTASPRQLEEHAAADAPRAARTARRRSIPLAPRRRERTNRVVVGRARRGRRAGHRGARRPGRPPAGPARRHGVGPRGDHARRRPPTRPSTTPTRVKVQLQSSDGEVTARAVVLPDGSGFLMAHELPGPRRRPHLPAVGRHRHRQPRLARPPRRRPRHRRLPGRHRPRRRSPSPRRRPAACPVAEPAGDGRHLRLTRRAGQVRDLACSYPPWDSNPEPAD